MSDKSRRRQWSLAVMIVGLVIIFASTAQAATFHVTTTADNGDNANPTPGSLRKAIIDANNNPGADTIDFNIAGAGVQTISPPAPLPTVTDPVVIDGYTQPGASVNTIANGDNAVLLIELSGMNVPAGAGLSISAGASTVRGLVINNFRNSLTQPYGIYLTGKGGNLITGNFIGTNASATDRAYNYDGIIIDGCANNIIGGTTPAARNIISGNIGRNIAIVSKGAINNLVQGNFIGTDASGTTRLFAQIGIDLEVAQSSPANNLIGGTAPGAGNVISGNGYAIQLNSKGDVIQGNLIGTDVTGKKAVPNTEGIYAVYSSGATIGGTTPSARNVISGNSEGIDSNTNSHGLVIQGNYIGTDISGTMPLGNEYFGIGIPGSGNLIGGTVAGAGNIIANNGTYGVVIGGFTATGNAIEGNSIYNNGNLGIELAPIGVNSNDLGDADTGVNNLQNYPVLASAVLSGGTTAVNATLNSTANTQFRVEFFANNTCDPSTFGQGQTFLGATNVNTNASGDANINQSFGGLSAGQFITATATDPAGNTSEFSQCRQITLPGSAVTLQFEASNYTINEQGATATINVTRTGGNLGAVSVQYSTLDGTATAGSDYTATSGTLNWADGDAAPKSIVVQVADDSLNEANETVNLTLTNPSGGATLGTLSAASLTINDDDPEPTLSISDVSQSEGDSGITNFNFTVTLSAPSGQIVRVDYMTADGTAHANASYLSGSGTLAFGPGQTSRQIAVRVNGDTTPEPNETFFVNLSNPVATTIVKAQGAGTILNDDAAPSTVQFEQPSYSVNEGNHFLLINVTRGGDATQAATVDYQTQDGAAHQLTDYNIARGTLRFASGEISKTLTLLVTDDAYVEDNETLSYTLSNPVNMTLGEQSTVQVTITDNDSNPNAPNAIDDVPNFVRQQYHDFLNREPDVVGFQGWQDILNNCAPGDTKCDRIEVSSAFFRSEEFQTRGYFVYRFYETALGRAPHYLEFTADLQRVSGFLSGQQLESEKVNFVTDFMARSEFKNKYEAITDPTAFVDLLSQTAGVTLANRNQLILDLQSNQKTRAEVVRAVAESPEVTTKYFNKAFVVMQYFGYLRRDPDILYLQWIDVLNQTGDYRVMVNGFMNSLEYRQRFGQ